MNVIARTLAALTGAAPSEPLLVPGYVDAAAVWHPAVHTGTLCVPPAATIAPADVFTFDATVCSFCTGADRSSELAAAVMYQAAGFAHHAALIDVLAWSQQVSELDGTLCTTPRAAANSLAQLDRSLTAARARADCPHGDRIVAAAADVRAAVSVALASPDRALVALMCVYAAPPNMAELDEPAGLLTRRPFPATDLADVLIVAAGRPSIAPLDPLYREFASDYRRAASDVAPDEDCATLIGWFRARAAELTTATERFATVIHAENHVTATLRALAPLGVRVEALQRRSSGVEVAVLCGPAPLAHLIDGFAWWRDADAPGSAPAVRLAVPDDEFIGVAAALFDDELSIGELTRLTTELAAV